MDPITGSTFCDGPSSSNCDYVDGCPRFNDIAGDDTPNVKNFTKRFIDEVEDQLAFKGDVMPIDAKESGLQSYARRVVVKSRVAKG